MLLLVQERYVLVEEMSNELFYLCSNWWGSRLRRSLDYEKIVLEQIESILKSFAQ